MCGIAGIARAKPRGVETRTLRRMVAAIQHRGPDGAGVYADERVGLAHVRLSVIDIEGGAQPMANEDGSLRVIYNGEIFNFPELRRELEGLGHRFRTRSDTEVLLHGYEQWGLGLPKRLNGQFAFAIYDRRTRSVFLARDRFGILPLFYAVRDGDLYFGSEIKALLASGEVDAALDPQGLDEVFTFWAALPPRTPFRGISALEPGCCARWVGGQLALRRYYAVDFPETPAESSDAVARLDELMHSSVGMRLLADVPVGGYLSGGLDSSAVSALASSASSEQLRTFSVSFDDPRFDESAFQREAAVNARSLHAVELISRRDIARVFPDVIRHAETPLLRTAPAPLYLLSQLTRQNGIKVVLSGEGADEVFLGYDLFKDTVVRLFCLRQPQSQIRPRLFERLYPNDGHGAKRGEFWARSFLGAGSSDDPLFSHLPRFRLTSWIKDFYSQEFRSRLGEFDPLAELRGRLPAAFGRWSALGRAAYLEMVTFM
jgi:asparagine synthase (glutamine-hydrolysing)